MQNFRPQPPTAGGFAPRPPLASRGWGLRPPDPHNIPPIANFWLRAWSRKRHVSMQNCYRYFVSDYDMKQCVKPFFQRPAVLIFRVDSTF